MNKRLKYGLGILLGTGIILAGALRIEETGRIKNELTNMHTHVYTIPPRGTVQGNARTYIDDPQKRYSINNIISETAERNPHIKDLSIVQPYDKINLLCNGGAKCPNGQRIRR